MNLLKVAQLKKLFIKNRCRKQRELLIEQTYADKAFSMCFLMSSGLVVGANRLIG